MSPPQETDLSRVIEFDARPRKHKFAAIKNGQQLHDAYESELTKQADAEQREREGTLIVHFSTFGDAGHKQQTAQNMLRNLRIKGFGVIQASIDGVEIPVE